MLESHLRASFLAFVAEQFPFALGIAEQSLRISRTQAEVIRMLKKFMPTAKTLRYDATPFVSCAQRLEQENQRFLGAIHGFFRREEIKSSLTDKERLWMLRGMIWTRAVDDTMKRLFVSSEIKYRDTGFQGKGFRSTGQEAIYAAALRLHRGQSFIKKKRWTGDVVAPVIRDLGVQLAFTDNDVALALNAQVGKDGPPLFGKDLHIGDMQRGVLPPAAPLAIATCTVTGQALAMKLKKERRVAISFIGEGGSSLGEWHEAINLAAARKLPVVFCVENNQTALSTPIAEQSSARIFGDKALGYGMPHVTLDGTDPEAIAAAFTWAAERARGDEGPALLELVSMRMCGHAHHDDTLYLGDEGYVDKAKYEQWAKRDPIKCYAKKLKELGVCSDKQRDAMQQEATQACERAVAELKARAWPTATVETERVFAKPQAYNSIESAPEFSSKGITLLESIALTVGELLRERKDTFVLGEDVGPPYGNAFMLFRPLMEKYGARFLNTPIAENAIIGACVGMALEGLRPIGEMQFNDFVASGFNQLVNNAAKFFYRTGQPVPMVLRMPFGGLRRAGPYHSQDTSPWFYRTPGLKIVVPSTPYDACALLKSAVIDDNPVLFYEHIALYRDPSIRQIIPNHVDPMPLGKAAFRARGSDLTLISYGAYVHRALRVASTLQEEDGVSCDVLDLRSLVPLDFDAIRDSVMRTGRVLLAGEDAKTGSILESIAAKIGEELFTALDAPVRVLGSKDTPVPYSPPLEDAYLVSNEQILTAARSILEF